MIFARERSRRRKAALLCAEYEKTIGSLRRETEELKRENGALKAQVLSYEEERKSVAEALIRAVRDGERLKAEISSERENEGRETALLAAKCRSLAAELLRKYPDAEDVKTFSAFTERLLLELGEEPAESEFPMDEVVAPKQPLDLAKLCKDLGLMEDDE